MKPDSEVNPYAEHYAEFKKTMKVQEPPPPTAKEAKAMAEKTFGKKKSKPE